MRSTALQQGSQSVPRVVLTTEVPAMIAHTCHILGFGLQQASTATCRQPPDLNGKQAFHVCNAVQSNATLSSRGVFHEVVHHEEVAYKA